MSLFYYPFILQGALMTADEFYFHERRGLPKWEKIGHPMDSLLTFVTLSIPAVFPYTVLMFKVFVGFSIFSSLFITKDEFIHCGRCSKGEHWVHAMLFILHPVVFMMTALIWMKSSNDIFLKLQPLIVVGFMFYQIIRWSFSWSKRQE
jgi:hypothetical protein